MIRVIHAGMHTSIQDLGRFGFAKYAVPQSGVMDEYSANFANLLLQNDKCASLLEISLQGPKLLIETKTQLVITGLNAKITLNNKPIPLNCIFEVLKGDLLDIKQLIQGNFLYIGCKGGFKTENIFGSFSFYKGISKQSKLKNGELLEMNTKTPFDLISATKTNTSIKYNKAFFESGELNAYKGPEFHLLTPQQQHLLSSFVFHVSKQYNRMAFRLEESLENNLEAILTSPVIPGTVQLTPEGKLIILMKDAQTTGGYPRILQLSNKAINKLAQKRLNEAVQFNIKDITF